MRVLVTGHLGYIGTVMVPMLLAEGYDVVGFDTDLFERSTFGSGIVSVPNIKKDIRDVEASDITGFDAVIHLAGLSNDPLGDLNPNLTYDINHIACGVREESGYPPVYLLLILQQLRCGGGRPPE
jgi:nucleoside-diphosphate-sugar epimerase